MKQHEKQNTLSLLEITQVELDLNLMISRRNQLRNLLGEYTKKINSYNDHLVKLRELEFESDPKWLEKGEDVSEHFFVESELNF